MSIAELRREYHQRICEEIIELKQDGDTAYPNFADRGSKASRAIAWGIVKCLGCAPTHGKTAGQTAGGLFETITKDFIEKAFGLLLHLRKGRVLEATDGTAELTPLREINSEHPRMILHASISCKWTIRSDRAQNARAEALNLIRNRKGHLPHIVAVTAEPLPTRIAALALGTGDLDCVYHFALPELKTAVAQVDNEDQMDMLNILIEGRRLRDISDLPFDLVT